MENQGGENKNRKNEFDLHEFIHLVVDLMRPLYIFHILLAWAEWDLNPRPLNSVQTLQPTGLLGHEFNSPSEQTLYWHSNFIVCSVSDFISAITFVSRHVYFNWNFVEVITWVQQNELIYLVIKLSYYIYIYIYVGRYPEILGR